jgi:hypothetical protein
MQKLIIGQCFLNWVGYKIYCSIYTFPCCLGEMASLLNIALSTSPGLVS